MHTQENLEMTLSFQTMSSCKIPHHSFDLVIVCQCPVAKCIHCFNDHLAKQINDENPDWNKCPDCKQVFDKLRVHYTNRTMTEWINRYMARLLYSIGIRFIR